MNSAIRFQILHFFIDLLFKQTDEEYAKGFEYVKDIFAKFNLTKPDMSQSNQVKSSSRSVSAPAVPPANFDWRTQPQNIVNPIRDQGTSTVDLSGGEFLHHVLSC